VAAKINKILLDRVLHKKAGNSLEPVTQLRLSFRVVTGAFTLTVKIP